MSFADRPVRRGCSAVGHHAPWPKLLPALTMLVCLVASTPTRAAGTGAQDRLRLPGHLDPTVLFEPLPQSFGTVHAFLQDRRGFVWFATDGGLFRYDGYQSRPFRVPRTPGGEPLPVMASGLGEDSQGGIWMSAEDGLHRLDVTRGTVRTFRHDPGNRNSLPADSLETLLVDRAGLVWLGSVGLHRFDPATNECRHYLVQGEPVSPRVWVIVEGEGSTLWIGTDTGLERFDRSTGRSTHYGTAEKPGLVQAIDFAPDGSLWIGSATGAYRFVPSTGELQTPRDARGREIPELREWVGTLIAMGDRIWVATSAGLVRLDPTAPDRLQFFQRLPAQPHPIEPVVARSMYVDRDGALWVAPQGQPICRLDPGMSGVARFRHDPTDPRSLDAKNVWAIAEDLDGTLVVGGNGGGLTRVDLGAGTMTRIPDLPGTPFSLPGGDVRGLTVDRRGRIWVATYDAGVGVIDLRAGRAELFRIDRGHLQAWRGNRIRCVYTDSRGRVWVGSYTDGLLRLDSDGTRLAHVALDGDPRFPIMAMAEARNGTIWAGTRDRGVLSVSDSGRTAFNRADPGDPRAISSNQVYAVHVDSSGAVWAGTMLGLERIDPAGGPVLRFHESDGLASDSVRAISSSADGAIWIATDRGLSRLDVGKRAFRTFTAADGFAHSYNHGAILRTRDGLLCLGGPEGLLVFDPARFPSNRRVPPVVFTDFRIGSRSVVVGAPGSPLERDIDAVTEVTLSPDQRSFTIEFAALNFRAPLRNRYLYRMDGLDDDWNVTREGERQVSYTGLPPGEYVFRVKGSNNDGVWNETPRSVRIIVLPPWWRTRTARAGFWIGMVSLVFGLMHLRTRAHRREITRQQQVNEELEQLNQARLVALRDAEETHEALRDLNEGLEQRVRNRTAQLEAANRELESFSYSVSHDLRAPLRAIDGFSEILVKEYAPVLPPEGVRLVGIVRDSTVQMGRLIDDLLAFSRSGREPITARQVEMTQLVRSVITSLERERAGRAIEFVISEMPPCQADVGLLRQVWMNLVANAIKFTRGREPAIIEIGYEPAEGQGAYFIRDNGAGFDMAYANKLFGVFQRLHSAREFDGTGVGLAIAQRIVQRHHGRIWAQGAVGQGATFWFTIGTEVQDRGGQ